MASLPLLEPAALSHLWECGGRAPHERFRQLIHLYHDCVEVYGLIRLAVLRQTPGIAPYAQSDRVLLVELALHGVFAEVPEVLFFHGWHGENMYTRYPDARDQHVWFNPGERGRLVFPYWRLLREYLRLFHRVPLPWKERCCVMVICCAASGSSGGSCAGIFRGRRGNSLIALAKKYCPWLRTPWRMWKAFLSNLIAFAKKYCPWLRTPWRMWKALVK